MLVLKCTQKAAQAFGFRRAELPQIPASDNPTLLGDWFVNAIRFGRWNALLLLNAETLYSFPVPYRKRDLTDIKGLFLQALLDHFLSERLPPAGIERVMHDYHDGLILARTDNRRVLGVMNDAARNYDVLIRRAGGPDHADLFEITKNINRTPQWILGELETPIDMLRERLEDALRGK